jgi:hypothetical protein
MLIFPSKCRETFSKSFISISEDKTFPPSHNLEQIAQIAKGFAPMLTEVLEDYIAQNSGSGVAYRIKRIKAAKRMLGVE